jgi:hypothetical protein
MSQFSHAGVSRLNGEFKVRFCNDALRQKVLIKNGHKDIDIIELKNPMTKEEAVAFLLSINFDNGNKEVRAALEAAQTKRAPKTTTAPKAKAKSKPTMEAIKAKAEVKAKADKKAAVPKVDISALEDAPY